MRLMMCACVHGLRRLGVAAAAGVWALAALQAQALEPDLDLPEPLTLSAALAVADERAHTHHALMAVRARLERARAELAQARAANDARVTVEGEAAWLEPNPESRSQERYDLAAGVRYRRRLSDFGQRAARERAEAIGLTAEEWAYAHAQQQYRIDVMAAFFEVLLADLAFSRDDEAMAIAFVRLDEARDRAELGELSDVELLELEARYQRHRRARSQSQVEQRLTRAVLGEALALPQYRPTRLIAPELPELGREPPPLPALLDAALAHNPRVKAIEARLESAQGQVEAARAQTRPALDAQAEAFRYRRDLSGRDDWRLGVVLSVPLYQGRRVEAAVAEARSEVYAQRAALERARSELRGDVRALWEHLGVLQVAAEASRSQQDFRDLAFDERRARYELELETDFGSAMVQTTSARLEVARVRYQRALTWARLEAAVGGSELMPLAKSSEDRSIE